MCQGEREKETHRHTQQKRSIFVLENGKNLTFSHRVGLYRLSRQKGESDWEVVDERVLESVCSYHVLAWMQDGLSAYGLDSSHLNGNPCLTS